MIKKMIVCLLAICTFAMLFGCVKREISVAETIDGNMKTYCKMSDGTWKCGDVIYKYRLEISGRMPNAVKDSTFVYLSNMKKMTFEQAYKAAGVSSYSKDYFPLQKAVLVEMKHLDTAEENGAAYEETPISSPSLDRFTFYSEEELSASILSGECDDEALLSLTEYYRPKTLDSDLVLSEIYVKDTYVALRYDFRAKEDAEGNPEVHYLFEWYRQLKPQSLKDELARVFNPGAVKQVDEFFIIGGAVLQDVFWEQDGNIFHAVTPITISLSQLRAFCEPEMVPIY